MARALELAAFQGRVAYIGIDVGQEAPAKLGLIQSKELRITGSIGSPGVWPETLRFLATSGIDLTPLVTQRFAIDEALDALDAAHHPSRPSRRTSSSPAHAAEHGDERAPRSAGPAHGRAPARHGMMRAARYCST